MSQRTRREFLKESALVGAAGLATPSLLRAKSSPNAASGSTASMPPVQVSWLGGQEPATSAGVAWGVPWPRGAVARNSPVTLRSADGVPIPTQHFPLAFWPDGSLKWSGLAVAAESSIAGPLTVVLTPSPAPATPVSVQQTGDTVEIVTGPLRCRIVRGGQNLVDFLAVNGHEVARAGHLVVLREDRSATPDADDLSPSSVREELYTSRVDALTVEQNGPVRAVVHLQGMHLGPTPASGEILGKERVWLPFSVRLYFTAGQTSIRLVHSFVFDGDQATDFIRGMGLIFDIPFREELQNRHVRFATDRLPNGSGGVFAEPILMSPGYRPSAVHEAAAMNEAQLRGERIPNLEALPPRDKANFQTIAVWDTHKLAQLAPDSFAFSKRTNLESSVLRLFNGSRAPGFAFFGDVSGGLGIGVKDFWQRYPAALELTGGSKPTGELRVWFWSPDAPAMDLRHYDTRGHDLRVSYEDYQPGFSTPNGVANTHDLTLFPTAAVPKADEVLAMSATASAPPLLVCTPEYLHSTHTLGVWSLPGGTVPGLAPDDIASADTQLDRAFSFYQGEVDRRRWYGFWDFGDVVRTYDPIRNAWMIDIGGHGWNNTELMPNAWLWFAFLRSGRADIFRFAEAMTRNTSEVDVYHQGRFAGLGSRHNVNHWGDGAKEARINEAFLKRFYFYLTTDERTGDLLREPLPVVENTVVNTPPLREVLPRDIKPVMIRIGPDWLAFASNWMAEWERTGDTRWRDYCLTGMRDIGAMPEAFISRSAFQYDPATKHLTDIGPPNPATSEFMVLFGGDQIAMELIDLIPCPEFARAWYLLCNKWARATPGPHYAKMRVTAYAANIAGDAALRDQAAGMYRDSLRFGAGDHFPAQPTRIAGPSVPEPVEEVPARNSFTPAIATPETSQWALNLLTTAELLRDFRAGRK